MLRSLAPVFVALAVTAVAGAVGSYALLVVGSRTGVEYYYGR